MDLEVPLDESFARAYSFAGHQCPRALTTAVRCIGHRISVRTLVDGTEGNVKAHLFQVFEALANKGQVSVGTVHLGHFLRQLHGTPGLQEAHKAFVHQVARLVEHSCKDSHFTENPLEGDRTWGGRADVYLTQHLCMGKGQEPQDRAVFVSAHVTSYLRLRKTHKQWGRRSSRRCP